MALWVDGFGAASLYIGLEKETLADLFERTTWPVMIPEVR